MKAENYHTATPKIIQDCIYFISSWKSFVAQDPMVPLNPLRGLRNATRSQRASQQWFSNLWLTDLPEELWKTREAFYSFS